MYLVGYSNGGRMAYRLACADPGAFSGVAAVEAVAVSSCSQVRPVPLIEVASTGDPLLTIPASGRPKHIAGHVETTVTALVRDWRQLEGCTPASTTTAYPSLRTTQWSHCDGQGRVALAVYQGRQPPLAGRRDRGPPRPASSSGTSSNTALRTRRRPPAPQPPGTPPSSVPAQRLYISSRGIAMKFWLCLQGTPTDEFVEAARDAEAFGYEGVWLPEHLVVKDGERTPHPTGYPLQADEEFPDPFLVFAAMSSVTTRLRFMTYVYVVPLRNVFSLTKQAATLALLSGNRFVLGTGVGWLPEEFDIVGEDWKHARSAIRGDARYHARLLGRRICRIPREVFRLSARAACSPFRRNRFRSGSGDIRALQLERAARFDGYMPMDGLHERTRAEFAAIDAYRGEHGLAGPYEHVIVAPIGGGPDEIRRIEVEDGITTVTVAPFFALGEPVPQTYEERRALTARYAEEIIAKV